MPVQGTCWCWACKNNAGGQCSADGMHAHMGLMLQPIRAPAARPIAANWLGICTGCCVPPGLLQLLSSCCGYSTWSVSSPGALCCSNAARKLCRALQWPLQTQIRLQVQRCTRCPWQLKGIGRCKRQREGNISELHKLLSFYDSLLL